MQFKQVIDVNLVGVRHPVLTGEQIIAVAVLMVLFSLGSEATYMWPIKCKFKVKMRTTDSEIRQLTDYFIVAGRKHPFSLTLQPELSDPRLAQ